ncbi:hypothetical protein IEQ34_004272 [Dendrobium chrysotoxum]|uniref:Acid phosphatase/vanadium-dependent haloperoxidase-related protein n=1 Tax=Dendrobium chrysotoxum TaxID=161865 RepID=A0AAV7HG23_DENCH|nr:hypothetical protein IEQ34_004272 [Dendrobium chrysotoxum]
MLDFHPHLALDYNHTVNICNVIALKDEVINFEKEAWMKIGRDDINGEILLKKRFKEKRWDSRRLLGSGGMPSSHSATVVALATAIGLQEGTAGSSFALAIVLASVVMYDASGIRLHAGRQAELLNQIVCELPPEHPLSSIRPLRELLGHTPLQVVAGAILGFLVSYLLRNS